MRMTASGGSDVTPQSLRRKLKMILYIVLSFAAMC